MADDDIEDFDIDDETMWRDEIGKGALQTMDLVDDEFIELAAQVCRRTIHLARKMRESGAEPEHVMSVVTGYAAAAAWYGVKGA